MANCNFEKIICSDFPVTPGRIVGDPIGIVVECSPDDADTMLLTQASTDKRLVRNSRISGFHFIIALNGNIFQLANVADTVPNLYHAYIPAVSWIPYDPLLDPHHNPDPYCIYIGLASQVSCSGMSEEQYQSLVRICCCIQIAYPLFDMDAAHVVSPDKINADPFGPYLDVYQNFEIPSTLFADVDDCLNSRGKFKEVSIVNGECVEGIGGIGVGMDPNIPPDCCIDNAAAIVVLQAQIDALKLTVEGLVTEVNATLPLAQAAYEETQSIRQYLASIADCLKCLCPADLNEGVIEYRLQAATDALVVSPNVNRWLNFPEKISDLVPERVHVGPLWTVDLDGGTHDAEVTVRYAAAEYCAGCKVWIDMVQCGVRTRIQENVLTAGVQVVTITWTGSLIITTPCPDLHFETGTDSTLGSPSYKVVEYASFKVTV